MWGQLILIALIFVLILILCFKKSPRSSDDSDDDTTTPAAAAAGNENAAATQRHLTIASHEKRKELASSSLYHRTLEEGDSVREIQSILAAARDTVTAPSLSSSSPAPSAPALANDEAAPPDGSNPSVSIEMPERSKALSSKTSPLQVARSDTAEESDTSLVASIRSLTGTFLDRVVGPPECIICLEGYEPGQSISWSKFGECDHIFHTKCIEEWLSKHNDCPLCRLSIVSVPLCNEMRAPTVEAP